MTLPAVGACTCASGSQVCSGKSGTLIAKPANNATNTHHCKAGSIGCACNPATSSGMENVIRPDSRSEFHHTMVSRPRNVSTLPASVYRKNFIAALRRSSLPQMPIKKNSGMSVNSKKT